MEIGKAKEGITRSGEKKIIIRVNNNVWHVVHPKENPQDTYTVIIQKNMLKCGAIKNFSMTYYHISDLEYAPGKWRKNFEMRKVGNRPASFHVDIYRDRWTLERVIEISHTDDPDGIIFKRENGEIIKTRYKPHFHGLVYD